MERTKRKCPSESFQVEKVICSYSKSKKLKFDESSKQKSELIIVKVEPLAFLKNEDEEDWSKCPKDDFPIVEESNKCPKCSISYKSKASMKNHIQVCKSEDQNQVLFLSSKNILFKKQRFLLLMQEIETKNLHISTVNFNLKYQKY